jgi:hypothetical protein
MTAIANTRRQFKARELAVSCHGVPEQKLHDRGEANKAFVNILTVRRQYIPVASCALESRVQTPLGV